MNQLNRHGNSLTFLNLLVFAEPGVIFKVIWGHLIQYQTQTFSRFIVLVCVFVDGSAVFKGCFKKPENVTLALPIAAAIVNMSVDKCVDLCTEKVRALNLLTATPPVSCVYNKGSVPAGDMCFKVWKGNGK